MSQTIQAHTYWVWTTQAQSKYSDRIAGTAIWEQYRVHAPISLVESGDIIDSGDYEGQTDLFSL